MGCWASPQHLQCRRFSELFFWVEASDVKGRKQSYRMVCNWWNTSCLNRDSKNMFIIWGFRCFVPYQVKAKKGRFKQPNTADSVTITNQRKWWTTVKVTMINKENDATERHTAIEEKNSSAETEEYVERLENTRRRFIGNSISFFSLVFFPLPNWFSHSW